MIDFIDYLSKEQNNLKLHTTLSEDSKKLLSLLSKYTGLYNQKMEILHDPSDQYQKIVAIIAKQKDIVKEILKIEDIDSSLFQIILGALSPSANSQSGQVNSDSALNSNKATAVSQEYQMSADLRKYIISINAGLNLQAACKNIVELKRKTLEDSKEIYELKNIMQLTDRYMHAIDANSKSLLVQNQTIKIRIKLLNRLQEFLALAQRGLKKSNNKDADEILDLIRKNFLNAINIGMNIYMKTGVEPKSVFKFIDDANTDFSNVTKEDIAKIPSNDAFYTWMMLRNSYKKILPVIDYFDIYNIQNSQILKRLLEEPLYSMLTNQYTLSLFKIAKKYKIPISLENMPEFLKYIPKKQTIFDEIFKSDAIETYTKIIEKQIKFKAELSFVNLIQFAMITNTALRGELLKLEEPLIKKIFTQEKTQDITILQFTEIFVVLNQKEATLDPKIYFDKRITNYNESDIEEYNIFVKEKRKTPLSKNILSYFFYECIFEKLSPNIARQLFENIGYNPSNKQRISELVKNCSYFRSDLVLLSRTLKNLILTSDQDIYTNLRIFNHISSERDDFGKFLPEAGLSKNEWRKILKFYPLWLKNSTNSSKHLFRMVLIHRELLKYDLNTSTKSYDFLDTLASFCDYRTENNMSHEEFEKRMHLFISSEHFGKFLKHSNTFNNILHNFFSKNIFQSNEYNLCFDPFNLIIMTRNFVNNKNFTSERYDVCRLFEDPKGVEELLIADYNMYMAIRNAFRKYVRFSDVQSDVFVLTKNIDKIYYASLILKSAYLPQLEYIGDAKDVPADKDSKDVAEYLINAIKPGLDFEKFSEKIKQDDILKAIMGDNAIFDSKSKPLSMYKSISKSKQGIKTQSLIDIYTQYISKSLDIIQPNKKDNMHSDMYGMFDKTTQIIDKYNAQTYAKTPKKEYTLRDLANFYEDKNMEMAFLSFLVDASHHKYVFGKNKPNSKNKNDSKSPEVSKQKTLLKFVKSFVKVMGRFPDKLGYEPDGRSFRNPERADETISKMLEHIIRKLLELKKDDIIKNAASIMQAIADDSSINFGIYDILSDAQSMYSMFTINNVEDALRFAIAYDKTPVSAIALEEYITEPQIAYLEAYSNIFHKQYKKYVDLDEEIAFEPNKHQLVNATKFLSDKNIIKLFSNLDFHSSLVIAEFLGQLISFSCSEIDKTPMIEFAKKTDKTDIEIIKLAFDISEFETFKNSRRIDLIAAYLKACTDSPQYSSHIKNFIFGNSIENVSDYVSDEKFPKFIDYLIEILENKNAIRDICKIILKHTEFGSWALIWSFMAEEPYSNVLKILKLGEKYKKIISNNSINESEVVSIFNNMLSEIEEQHPRFINKIRPINPKEFMGIFSNVRLIYEFMLGGLDDFTTTYFITCLQNNYKIFTNKKIEIKAITCIKNINEFIESLNGFNNIDNVIIEICAVIDSGKLSFDEFNFLFEDKTLGRLKGILDPNFQIRNMQELLQIIILLPLYKEKKFLKKIIASYLALRKSRMDTERLKSTFDSVAIKIIATLSDLESTSSDIKYLLKETYNLIIIGNDSTAPVSAKVLQKLEIREDTSMIYRIRQYAINLDRNSPYAMNEQFPQFREKIHNSPGIEDINLTAALKKFWEDGQIEFLETVWNELIKFDEIEGSHPDFAALKKFRDRLPNISNVRNFFNMRDLSQIIDKFSENDAFNKYPTVYINTVLLLYELENYYSASPDLDLKKIVEKIENDKAKSFALSKEISTKYKEFFSKYQKFVSKRNTADVIAAARIFSELRSDLNKNWTMDKRVKMAIDNILKNLEQKVYSDVTGMYIFKNEKGGKISLSLNGVTPDDAFKNYLLFVEDLLSAVIAGGLDGYPVNFNDDDISKEFSLEINGPNVNYFSMAKINLMEYRIKDSSDSGKVLQAMKFIDSGIELFSRVVLSDIKRLIDYKLKENEEKNIMNRQHLIDERRNIEVERLMSRFYKIGAIYNLGQASGEVIKFLTGGKGVVVFEGQAWGRCILVNNANDASKVQLGDIIISKNPTPELSAAMMSASAIITEEGGSTSHAAMIAREHKKPCIVGRYKAMSNFKDGEFVFIDTKKGIIEKISEKEAEKYKNSEIMANFVNNPQNKLRLSEVLTKEDIKEYFSEYRGENNSTPFVIPLSKATDAQIVGGKAANLAILKEISLNSPYTTPDGFVVTTLAYTLTILKNYYDIALENMNQASDEFIENFFVNMKLPKIVENQIAQAYSKIDKDLRKLVAVRSSATVEDTGESTFAGLHESFLFRSGLDTIIRDIKRCWASMYSERAKKHRASIGIDEKDAKMAVVVQRMIDADYSGVIYTALTEDIEYYNPDINKNVSAKEKIKKSDTMMKIEIIKGQGEELVSGRKTPSIYIANKADGSAIKISGKEDETINANMPTLIASAIIVENTYSKSSEEFNPQDIEFCIKNGKIYLLQTRDIAIAKAEKKAA